MYQVGKERERIKDEINYQACSQLSDPDATTYRNFKYHWTKYGIWNQEGMTCRDPRDFCPEEEDIYDPITLNYGFKGLQTGDGKRLKVQAPRQ